MIKNIFKIKIKFNAGFTIIETMITIAIFLIVVMIGMDALLNASSLYQKSRDQRSLMDNLSFIMEDTSRNIRVGSTYRCVEGVFAIGDVAVPKNCTLGGALVFENSNGTAATNDQWVYKLEAPPGLPDLVLWKSIDSGVNWTQLNPDEIKFHSASGFSVTGALTGAGGDNQQPLVTIRLIGKIVYKTVEYPFSLQTTVSQRIIDDETP